MITEKIIKFFLILSGLASAITLLLIVLFSFVEFQGIINADPIEEENRLYINLKNPVKDLSSTDIKNIFDEKITNWNEITSFNHPIQTFYLDDIEEYVDEDELEDFDNLDVIISNIIRKNQNIIAFIPPEYVLPNHNIKELKVQKISFWNILMGKEWYPTTEPSPLFGILPLLIGTFLVTLLAIVIAFPFAMSASIYIGVLASNSERRILKFFIELLNSIPSVVFGFFGLIVIVPWIQKTFNLPVGETALTGGIILAIMILPTIITLAEDALRSTPQSLKLSSFALGSNKWQMISRVMIPYAMPGIKSAFILGLGRAFGETMAVLMVTGNASGMPNSILNSVRTIPATIAAELGEAPVDSLHYKSLFLLGFLLFLITFIINIFIVYRKKHA